MPFKFGKLAPKHNAKTLKLDSYLLGKLPEPAACGWEHKIPATSWGMYANDSIGDCTCACIAHMVMNWTSNTGSVVTPTEHDVIKAYSAASGYDPATGANDNGAAITDVLDYWHTHGLGSDKIVGWVQVNEKNLDLVRSAVYIFGAIDIGFNVPQSAMDQFSAGKPWEVVHDDGGIVGGHSVPVFGYNMTEGCTAVTWGQTQPLGWPFFEKYVDEVYAAISHDWLAKNQHAPNGLNMTQLAADLKAIGV